MSLRSIKKTMQRIVEMKQGQAPGQARSSLASTIGQCLVLVPAGVLASSLVFASPQGGTVVGGTGNIQQPSATQTLVNQQSQNMAIDWRTFNLAAGDVVRFVQPSASASVLNRILDQNPSQIFGSIQANGRVFLANPNGLIFGEGATVNVGSFVATTLNANVQDFMLSGSLRLGDATTSAGGAIINRGLIQAATGGSVSLVGGSVSNEGVIVATKGSVNLASGRTAVLDFDGDGLLSFAVSGDVLENTIGAKSAVANSGTITADGGQVLLTGKAAKDVFANVVNNTGIIQANTIDTSGGTIRLVGGDTGIVANSGTLRAKGDDAGEKGGTVQMLGEKVGLFDYGKIDVSGDAGGGTALVGGDYQGKNPAIRNASMTYVGKDATIDASAIGNGDGGKVIVWADDTTHMHGSISAKGGAQGGHGGFVETSGKGTLNVTGARVDTLAPKGVTGIWLLDPTNIDVVLTVNADAVLADVNAFATADIAITTPATSSVDVALINGAASDVMLQATQNINFLTAVNITGAGIGLTARAGNNIALNNSITTNGGAINLTANDAGGPASTTGSITGGGTLISGGGAVTLNATAMTLGAINSGAGLLTINNSGAATQSGVFAGSGGLTKTGGGTLTLNQANTYTGTTAVNVGQLTLSGGSAIADTSAVTVASGATLSVGAAETVASLVSGGTISGAGKLTAATYGFTGGTITSNLGLGVLTQSSGSTALNGTADALTVNINGGTLTLGSADRLANGAAVTVAGGTLAMGAFSDTVASVALTSGSITGSTGVLTSTAAFDMQGGTASAILGGTNGLTKTGAGTTILSGANTYTGTTAVNVGQLTLSGGSAIADTSAVTVASGATLSVGAAETVASLVSGGTISGAGKLTAATYGFTGGTITSNLGLGVLTQSSGSTALNGTADALTVNINGGTLTLGSADRLANGAAVTVAGGTLDIGAFSDTVASVALTNGSITGSTGVLTSTAAFDMQGGTASAILGGTNGLTKTGAGTTILSGANTYTGTTAVNVGQLTLSGGSAIADTSAVTVASGATLSVGAAETVASLVSGGTISGAGKLTAATYGFTGGTITSNLGLGVLTQSSGSTALNGTADALTVNINGGTLTLGSADRLANGAAVTVAGGTLDIGAFSDTVASVALTNGSITGSTGVLTSTAAFDMQGGTASAILGGTNGLTKSGGGTTILSGANTYTGTTAVNVGQLTLSGGSAIADTSAVTVASGATLALTGSETIGSLAGAGHVTLGAFTLTEGGDNTSTTFSGDVGGTGGLTKAGSGTTILSGVNTYIGATNVNTGTLSVNGTAIADTSAVTVASGATLALTGSETIGSLAGAGHVTLGAFTLTEGGDNTSTTFSGDMGGTGGLTKAGSGTTILSGVNTYIGTTAVNAGTLVAANANALGTSAGGTTVTGGAQLTIQNVAVAEGITVNGGTLALTGNSAQVGSATFSSTSNILDYTNYTGAVAVNQQTGLATGITAPITTFANMGTVKGNGVNSTLTGLNSGETFTLNGSNKGTATWPAANTLNFEGINNLVGGTNVAFVGTGSLTGSLIDGGGATALSGTITTGGNQTYNGAVTLAADTSLTGANIAFGNTLNGTNNLTLAAAGGNVTFSGLVGGVTPLGDVLISGTNILESGGLNAASFVANGSGGATTLTGTLNTTGSPNGIRLINDNLVLHANMNAGPGDVYLRAAHGDINNREPVKYTLATNGTLHVITSDPAGVINLNLNVPNHIILETSKNALLDGIYNSANITKPAGIAIINATFGAILGSELKKEGNLNYYIDPALFNQQISLFSLGTPELKMPEDQLEEVLGKYNSQRWYQIAGMPW